MIMMAFVTDSDTQAITIMVGGLRVIGWAGRARGWLAGSVGWRR
jgi:hypothetical protein